MQGVKDVEKILHFQFSAVLGVEKQEWDREKRVILDWISTIAKRQRANCGGNNAYPFIVRLFEDGRSAVTPRGGEYSGEQGKHSACKSVVKVQKAVGDHGESKRADKERGGEGYPSFRGLEGKKRRLQSVKRVDHNKGQRKGHKHAHFVTWIEDKISKLYHRRKGREEDYVAKLAFSVLCPLGDEKGEDGEGDAPDDPQNHDVGKEQIAHVVAHHSRGGDYFKRIVAEECRSDFF